MIRSAKRLSSFCTHVLAFLSLATAASADSVVRVLAEPDQMFATGRRVTFYGQNGYSLEPGPSGPVLRSTPNLSASGLYQELQIDGRLLRKVIWTWRVDTLQSSADVRRLDREDVGAALFFVFGEPSFLNRDVPTLAYVWTSTPVANGSVLPSLRLPSLRYVQIRGRADEGAWRSERRDIASDFRSSFGRDPPDLLYVAFFNDNDQTGEATSALFGPVKSLP